MPPPPRPRDADRSRRAILDAGEGLFSQRGFAATSLQDIATAAGVSRGTPSYFFGAKELLYRAVLERAFAAREDATCAAFAPVVAWAEGDGDDAALRRALRSAVRDYVAFLLDRPAFARLIAWEGLADGARIAATPRRSAALHEAFRAIRAAGRRRGTAPFAVEDAVLLVVSLAFSPVTQQSTFMAALGRDLHDPAVRRRHVALVVDQVMCLVARPRPAGP